MYDLMILGGGPAGYVAAERAGARGMKVLLVERKHLGGVCLNEGCIPSKTLLNAAKIFYQATHGSAYGVEVDGARFDFERIQQRKAKVIETLRNGVAGLMKKYGVDVVEGSGRLVSNTALAVDGTTYEGRNILVATGSSPATPPIPGMELPHVVDSTGILSLPGPVEKLCVIGGGVIGCEFACFFGSLGIPVTVIEMLPEICPTVDPDLAKILRSELGKKGITFRTGAAVTSIDEQVVRFQVGDQEESVEADQVLVSTGRTVNVDGLGLEDVRVDFDRRGIRVDERCTTNIPGVWAAGDVTGRAWLAHAASRMGEVVVNNIAGRTDHMRYDTIPGVIYTSPEVATVGLSVAAARERGIPVVSAKLPMTANGRFLAEHDGERGLAKVVVHAETRALLGVHMIGAVCSEMIFGAASMIETEVRVQEIQDLIFPHPTASELMREAVLSL